MSRSLPAAADGPENALISRARRLLGSYDRAEIMIQAGLYEHGSDPEIDRAIAVWPALDDFLSQSEEGSVSDSFARLAECLGEASDLDPQEPG